MAPKTAKGNVSQKQHGRKTARQKRDVDIMNTNDSSIVSKRSVSKLYFSLEPDFYEPFVPKFVRRNPLINRGYWLRMHAVEQVVHRFLTSKSGKPKVVVNLGCGYDPLPFQFWHRYPDLTKGVTFIDVDYPQLIERKRDRMLSSWLLRGGLLRTHLRACEPPVHLRSDQYIALGCDLKDLHLLERILRIEVDMPSSSVLFVAEVSATYMPVADADALIRWASSLEDARFCILEQYLPCGSMHPWARTMLAHFDKLQTPIQAVKKYTSLDDHKFRFLNLGWSNVVIANNMWELWADDGFTPPALRQALDAVEPFDEWEEFALFASHYILLVASTEQSQPQESRGHVATALLIDQEMVPDPPKLQLRHESKDLALTPRRFGAAFRLEHASVAIFGGQGTQSRLSNTDVLTQATASHDDQPDFTTPVSARMCHTTTMMSNGAVLLVGGRGSPTQALADCWLVRHRTWTRVADLATARYRHCATAVRLTGQEAEIDGVLVFGGRRGDGTSLADWVLWTANDGWQSITVDGSSPSARFGSAISTMGTAQDRGLLVGGLGPGGTAHDVFEWSLTATPTLRLTLNNRTNDLRCRAARSTYSRIGASLVPWEDSVLLIGGVSHSGVHRQSEDFLLLTTNGTKIDVTQPTMQLPATWPLLVGMGIVSISCSEVLLTGGGAVCFSMGSFWNDGIFTLTNFTVEEQGMKPWRVSLPQISGTADAALGNDEFRKRFPHQARNNSTNRTIAISRIQIETAEDFANLVARARPIIIEDVDIGPCTQLWTMDYLKEKIGAERELIVHESSSDRMTFQNKNFQYVKKNAGAFLDSISQGNHEYLRAVNSSQPNKIPTRIEDDFPNLAADFQLPSIFDQMTLNSHSSPLRISGPVTLWLHYDVLANILCQVRGTKTLTLFPPSDVKHLSFVPGSSSSNLDIHSPRTRTLGYTHPHIAHLRPSDILFIPPMWSHTATPQDGVSVAVNVFWRDLDPRLYAAGRDVYGNRDLQAYENGRRDVERIVRAFRNVPVQVASFYLQRLANEIQGNVGKVGKKREVEGKRETEEEQTKVCQESHVR